MKTLNTELTWSNLQNKTVVVKLGGNAMIEPALLTAFAEDIVKMRQRGIHVFVVHGGGPFINEALDKMNIEGVFIDGMRQTSMEALKVAQWALLGQVNPDLVERISRSGAPAIGVSGHSAHIIQARPYLNAKVEHSLGFVGEVCAINVEALRMLEQYWIPVLAPIGVDLQGQAWNINADWVAAALAQALNAEVLFMLTNTSGVLDEQGHLIESLDTQGIDEMIASKKLSGGMLPKISGALETAQRAGSVWIIDGRIAHNLDRILSGARQFGTCVHA